MFTYRCIHRLSDFLIRIAGYVSFISMIWQNKKVNKKFNRNYWYFIFSFIFLRMDLSVFLVYFFFTTEFVLSNKVFLNNLNNNSEQLKLVSVVSTANYKNLVCITLLISVKLFCQDFSTWRSCTRHSWNVSKRSKLQQHFFPRGTWRVDKCTLILISCKHFFY